MFCSLETPAAGLVPSVTQSLAGVAPRLAADVAGQAQGREHPGHDDLSVDEAFKSNASRRAFLF